MADEVPTSAQRQLIERYLDELERWNRRLNLTRVPRGQAWERHAGETLDLLDAASLEDGWSVVDIGSGPGVPGLLIAVLRPGVALTLVEADQRKAGFLVHAAGLLELDNVRVCGRRAEELAGDPAHRGRYDAAVSRAAAAPPLLVELAMPLLRPSACLWALVGDAGAAAGELPAGDDRPARAAAPGILAVENRRPAL